MKQVGDYEFGKDWVIYVKDSKTNEILCYDFEHYEKKREFFAGKELIIAPNNVGVFFRIG
jgi:hypothetical protein